MSALTPQDYADALYVQSACNLSGVVFAFAKVMEKICKDSEEGKHGTEWKNTHPISQMYAEQIRYLACGSYEREDGYGGAYEACEKEALKTLKPGQKPSWRTLCGG